MAHAFTSIDAAGQATLHDRCLFCAAHRHSVEDGESCDTDAPDTQTPACRSYPDCGCDETQRCEPEATTLEQAIREVRDAQLALLRARRDELLEQRAEDSILINKLRSLLAAQTEELLLLRTKLLRYEGVAS